MCADAALPPAKRQKVSDALIPAEPLFTKVLEVPWYCDYPDMRIILRNDDGEKVALPAHKAQLRMFPFFRALFRRSRVDESVFDLSASSHALDSWITCVGLCYRQHIGYPVDLQNLRSLLVFFFYVIKEFEDEDDVWFPHKQGKHLTYEDSDLFCYLMGNDLIGLARNFGHADEIFSWFVSVWPTASEEDFAMCWQIAENTKARRGADAIECWTVHVEELLRQRTATYEILQIRCQWLLVVFERLGLLKHSLSDWLRWLQRLQTIMALANDVLGAEGGANKFRVLVSRLVEFFPCAKHDRDQLIAVSEKPAREYSQLRERLLYLTPHLTHTFTVIKFMPASALCPDLLGPVHFKANSLFAKFPHQCMEKFGHVWRKPAYKDESGYYMHCHRYHIGKVPDEFPIEQVISVSFESENEEEEEEAAEVVAEEE